VCDRQDNNCDGSVDEGVTDTYYIDFDGDGYGSTDFEVEACDEVTGFVSNILDCDDRDDTVNPDAVEFCDGVDDDCNGIIDDGVATVYYRDADGDGHGDPSVTSDLCSPDGEYIEDDTDCNDADAMTYPGALEVCDGGDNDCNGLVDDDAAPLTYYRDEDGDGYGVDDDTVEICGAPEGYVDLGGDCEDDDDEINPGEIEVCDYIDADCDGEEDPACFVPDYFDFNNCGASGYDGPTDSQCSDEYTGTTLEDRVTVTDGIQEWVAPVDGEYTITAIGARGASGDSLWLGGMGSEVTGTFILNEGDVLYIAVG
jgi:hypothetical protein